MDETTRKNMIEQNMQIVAPLFSGNTEGALTNLDTLIESYKAAGDMDDVKVLQGFRDRVAAGEGQRVMTELMASTGYDELGGKAIDNLLSVKKDVREEGSHQASMMKTANELEWGSEQDKQNAYIIADKHNWDTAKKIIELSSVRSLGSGNIDFKDIIGTEDSLRKEFDKYTEPYRTIEDNVDAMERMLEDPTGAVDFAVIRQFNKALDPNSVVRESEAAGTQQAQSLFNRIYAAVENVDKGYLLSADGRADILEASRILREVSKEKTLEERNRIMVTVNDFPGILSEERVFGPGKDTKPPVESSTNFEVPTGSGVSIKETPTAAPILSTKDLPTPTNTGSTVSEDEIPIINLD
jgi:hypothetical protein